MNNTWNRFEANFGRQLEQNQVLLHDLDYASDDLELEDIRTFLCYVNIYINLI